VEHEKKRCKWNKRSGLLLGGVRNNNDMKIKYNNYMRDNIQQIHREMRCSGEMAR
jgi:hypothetical protein